ncbi:hypothetical protein STEG23_003046, partial [Scotinomys teguina]
RGPVPFSSKFLGNADPDVASVCNRVLGSEFGDQYAASIQLTQLNFSHKLKDVVSMCVLEKAELI